MSAPDVGQRALHGRAAFVACLAALTIDVATDMKTLLTIVF